MRPSRQPPRPLHPNPLLPTQGAVARGEGALATPPTQRRERGFILSVDANGHVYRVQLNSGPTLDGIPRTRSSTGDIGLLKAGQPVIIDWALGTPYISAVLPLEAARAVGDRPEGVTDSIGHGGQDPTLSRNMGRSARATGEPDDLIPGDHAVMGPDGASVAALHGRIAQLRGSALAVVRANGHEDRVDIITGLLRLVTWMGEANYTNDDGKTSFTWRGGADQLTQTGADEEKYTIRLDVGHAGNLVKLEVTTPDGVPVFRFHVDPSGKVELYARGGLTQHAGGDGAQVHPQRFHGSRDVEIEGADLHRVAGDARHTFEAGLESTVSRDETKLVGQDQHVTISRDKTEKIGGSKQVTVTGDDKTVVAGGDHTVEVKDAGKIEIKQSGTGDLALKATQGQIKLDTTKGDGIELGAGADAHAVRFEQLTQKLDQVVSDLNAFKSSVKAHVHPVAGTAAGLSPPLQALTGLDVTWDDAKSSTVKLK